MFREVMREVLFFVFVLSFFSACSSSKTVKDKDLNFLKARKGTSWVYEGKLLGEKRDITIKITKAEGKKFTDNKGQVYIKDENGYKNEYYYQIRYPLKKGATWVNKTDKDTEVATIEDVSVKFKFGDDEIKNCIKVSYVKGFDNGARSIVLRTFCPDLWLVKMETYYETYEGVATKQSEFILKSFVY